MALPLKESNAVAELARALVDFLPGSGRSSWKGHVNFRTVAEKVGLGDFVQQGSKLPMLTALIERTLEYRRGLFERLIIETVRAGLAYRKKNNAPVTVGEMREINRFIQMIGFKFPELWDPEFLSTLADDTPVSTAAKSPGFGDADKQKEEERRNRSASLADLKNDFFALHQDLNRNRAGIALEKLLNGLFSLYKLAPREPFQVVGEQIDGSFELDHEIYLMEAKWHKEQIQAKDLYAFREKVEGKSKFTRGVFISINGFTSNAVEAITKGKQPTFFLLDGLDLMMLLSEFIELPDFLRRRHRFLAEEGLVSVPHSKLV
jgi:Restriction endonuclease